MRIDVSDKYCITSDTDQMTVNEKRIVKKEGSENLGKETLSPLGYFATLAQCYRFLLRLQVRLSDATSFKELMVEAERIKEESMRSIRI